MINVEGRANDEHGTHESMVQRVYRQIPEVGIEANIVIATSMSQKDSIKVQLGKKVDVVIEPERRNTFPAIVLATWNIVSGEGLITVNGETAAIQSGDTFHLLPGDKEELMEEDKS